MCCRHGHFSSANFLRARGSVMDHQIIFSPKRSKWVCRIVLTSRPKQRWSDLMAVAARRRGGGKHYGLSLIGTRFRATQLSLPNTNSVSGPFDTKRFHLPQGEAEKRKRADHPKFPMPTKFVCSFLRISSSGSSGQ